MNILHLDLKAYREDRVEFCYFWDNPIISDQLPLSRTSISNLIQDIEKSYYEQLTWDTPPNSEQSEQIGQKLYNWLDSGDRLLASKIKNKDNIILAISATERLSHLPWELLHDGEKFLVERSIIPIRWVKRQANKISSENNPQNRALNLLFMATEAENSTVQLHYEEEEARILEANQRFRLFLQVEESGCLEMLKDLLANYGAGYFDVFHLTGHAYVEEDAPYFITETEIGEENKASARDITKVFQTVNFPPLMFLSGCHSGQAAQEGATPSLAEALIKNGAKALLGWGHQVFDTEATDAAAIIYEELNRGNALADPLAITYQNLLEKESKDWHLLRLYVGDTLPSALVTEPRGRPPAPPLSYKTRFLDRGGKVTVADRMSFVGRRRQIQHCIKALMPPSEKVGVIIYGFGGYGKSSLALRLCDRLTDFIPLVWERQIDQDKFASKLSE